MISLVEVEVFVVFNPFHCGEVVVDIIVEVEAAKHLVPKPDSLVQRGRVAGQQTCEVHTLTQA
jgi:hypothetical protein